MDPTERVNPTNTRGTVLTTHVKEERISIKRRVLDGWCEEIGRDPGEIERSTTIRAHDSDEQRDAFVKTGISHLLIGMQTPWDFAALERLVRWRDSRQP
jgi:hypothetical protein